jgi:hypothetical protein
MAVPVSNPADLETFNRLIASWKEAYRFADSASVTIKLGSESTLLIGRIILHTARPEFHQTLRLDTTHISARRSLIPLQEEAVNRLITSAGEGTMVIDRERFSLRQEGRNLDTALFPIYHPEVTGGTRIPALRIFGIRKKAILQSAYSKGVEHLDWELKAADQPFDTFDELLSSLGLPTLIKIADMTTLEVIAGSPGLIHESSRIKQGNATVICRLANGLDPTQLKLGFKVQRAGKIDRLTKSGNSFEWTRKEEYQEGSIRIDVGDAPVLQAFLSFENTSLHQWWVLDPDKRFNARHAIYEVFDHELGVLKTFINGQGRDSARDFEKGISFLANLLGFAMVPLSVVPQLADAPDLIVSSPSGHAAIIECTIRNLNENNKLSKLVQRTAQLRERLRSAGLGHLKTQPVIVSLLTRAELQADLPEAGKNGIAVISKEDLQSLLSQATLFPNAEELFSRLSDNIPRPDAPGSLFAGEPS